MGANSVRPESVSIEISSQDCFVLRIGLGLYKEEIEERGQQRPLGRPRMSPEKVRENIQFVDGLLARIPHYSDLE